jgi:hypothetical protein
MDNGGQLDDPLSRFPGVRIGQERDWRIAEDYIWVLGHLYLVLAHPECLPA